MLAMEPATALVMAMVPVSEADTVTAEAPELGSAPALVSAGVMVQPTALVTAPVGDTEPDLAMEVATELASASMPIWKSDRLIPWPGGENPTRS